MGDFLISSSCFRCAATMTPFGSAFASTPFAAAGSGEARAKGAAKARQRSTEVGLMDPNPSTRGGPYNGLSTERNAVKGFILQPTYRVESGRPVVHLFGRLETGDPFLVRDDTLVPQFFIPAGDAARARKLGANRIHATDLRAMHGGKVSR